MANSNKSVEKKSCFVIMPISDIEGYESGHFSRVYTHLIKPACEDAGYDPIRADEVASTNYIVIDILSKIVESELVICDLSGKNPNVLYELGIRQAFNLPTVLIKDIKTDKIFDIQGLRYMEYNQTLRVDAVQKQVKELSKVIRETMKAKGQDINSLVQLLGVKPAKLPSQVELSSETSVILSAIKDLSNRITSLEQVAYSHAMPNAMISQSNKIQTLSDGVYKINGEKMSIGDTLYILGEELGQLADVTPHQVLIKNKNGKISKISANDPRFDQISIVPF